MQHSVVVLDSVVAAAESLAASLCARGIPATYAANAREAAAAAAIASPTAIVMDLDVRGAVLDQLCEELRMIAPGAKLIALSDWSDPSHFDRAMACGFDHFLAKPAALDTIVQALR